MGGYQLIRYRKLSFLDEKESIIQTVLLFGIPAIYILTIALPFDNDHSQQDANRIIDFFVSKKVAMGSPDYMIQWVYSEYESPWNITLCSYKTTVADRPPVIAGAAFLFKIPMFLWSKPLKQDTPILFFRYGRFLLCGLDSNGVGFFKVMGYPRKKERDSSSPSRIQQSVSVF